MSKLCDYSKFDHIGDDDEEGTDATLSSTGATQNSPISSAVPDVATKLNSAPAATEATASPPRPNNTDDAGVGPSMRRNPKNNRFVYEFNGKPVYEWEQTLDEVILYIPAPPVSNAKDLHCNIKPHHLQVGLQEIVKQKGSLFIDEDTFGIVDEDASTWTLEDGTTLAIYLIKANPGQVWDMALKGRLDLEMDPVSKEQVRKDLMLERFQNENPGMDFRGAEFNGNVPDPRTFMGGIKYP